MIDNFPNFQIEYELRPDYLRAKITCDTVNPEMVVSYLHEMTEKCEHLDRTHLLIERDIPATLSDADAYFSGTEFAHMGISRMKIAFVDQHLENQEHLEFALLVANNRGGHLSLFQNAEEAEKWLLEDYEAVT